MLVLSLVPHYDTVCADRGLGGAGHTHSGLLGVAGNLKMSLDCLDRFRLRFSTQTLLEVKLVPYSYTIATLSHTSLYKVCPSHTC